MNIPAFKYHPDPIATGSIVPSDTVCECCGQARGFIYTGPVYSIEELDECICPWCIADNTAHDKFGAEFTDAAGVGGYSKSLMLSSAVIEDVVFRTPGFTGWQQERWLACCGDAAAFLGRAGREEIEEQWLDAVVSLQEDCGMSDGRDWQDYFKALDSDGSPTAYIFQCLHCGRHLGYSDCD